MEDPLNRKRELEAELRAIDLKYKGRPLPDEEFGRWSKLERELFALEQELARRRLKVDATWLHP
jgi:hypothetical protein